ncbi:MAG: hypothetical protein ACOCQD_01870 [archaeon]
MEKKKIYLVIGIVVLVGAVLSMSGGYGFGLSTTTSYSALTDNGEEVGMDVSLSRPRGDSLLPFATMEKGETYKFQADITNTGSLDWPNSQFSMRLGTKDSEIVNISASECGADEGECLVERCSEGTDVEGCRERIVDDWKLKEYNGSWETPNSEERTAAIRIGELEVGESKTIEFQLTPPDTDSNDNPTDGETFPLLGNLGVISSSGHNIVNTAQNELTVGSYGGDIVLNFVSLMSVLGALGLITKGLGFL